MAASSVAMKSRCRGGSMNTLAITGLLGHAVVALSLAATAKAATYTTFDPPGSVFTRPTSINQDGVITGFYGTDLFSFHGFVRAKDGTFTTFDPEKSQATFPLGIDSADRIFGSYSWQGGGFRHARGFVRDADGSIAAFQI